MTTGEASDSYGNLFTPTGFTFAIWGLIYLLLLAYVLYQFGFHNKKTSLGREKLFTRINRYFLVTSIANIAWIFAWHHGVIWLSVLIMLTLLFALIQIADVVNKEKFTVAETLCIRAPFGVYFGWITVATIANITVLLVSLGWDGFGIAEATWTVVVLLVGAAIGILRMRKDKSIFYGAVLVWAYGGIWFKHASSNGFDGAYPNVIATVVICMIAFVGMIGFLGYEKMRA